MKLVPQIDTNEAVRLTLQELRLYIEDCIAKSISVETASLMTILFRVPEAGQFIMDNHISLNVAGHTFRFNEKDAVEDFLENKLPKIQHVIDYLKDK
jgi:hypothetical protein